jgi:outer membrane biosynthesis protein TonB
MQKVKTLVLLLLMAATAACGGTRAQVIEDQPTLAVPPVPPRTIEPQPATEPTVIPPVPDLSPTPAPPPKTRAAAPKTNDTTKPEPKPEAPPEAAAAAGTSSPPPVEPLRTPTTPSGPEAMRQIQESLLRTDNVLSRVDYQKLTPDSRATYDAAKNFKLQAEEALKKDDINQARAFAQRAENIARKLEPR